MPLLSLVLRFDDRLDIWHRDVPWSSVKQLRSVVETVASVDDVFEHFSIMWMDLGATSFDRAVQKHKQSESDAMERALQRNRHWPFKQVEQNALTGLQYRMMSFPWCVPSQKRLTLNQNIV